jgi:CBS domain-containing protein
MLVRNLHDRISARLAVIDHRSSVCTAALAMCAAGIGLVVVFDGAGKADLVRHLATASDTPLRTLMSRSIISCTPDDDLHAVWQTMTSRSLQNIPVLEAGTRPIGVLDILDAMHALFEQEERLETMLSDYVAGIGYR